MSEERTIDLHDCHSSVAAILALSRVLRGVEIGEKVELITANAPEMSGEIAAFCNLSGHAFTEHVIEPELIRFVIEKGRPGEKRERCVVIVSTSRADALTAGMEAALIGRLTERDAHLILRGEAVIVLAEGYDVKRDGTGRLFERLAHAEQSRRGYMMPEQLLAACEEEGVVIHADGPSFERFVGKDRDNTSVRVHFVGTAALTQLCEGAHVVMSG